MKSIIFNAEEVRATLGGTKTQFRKVVKPQPISNINPVKVSGCANTWQWSTKESRREAPYEVGDEIFVKESWNILCGQVVYKANYEKASKFFWMSASRMKQEQSRLTLRIKDIRVEKENNLWVWVVEFET